MSSTESRTFQFGLHCTIDDHCAVGMASLKRHLDQCAEKPPMSVMCSHCGSIYQDMCTPAHHLNVRKMHLEVSKIQGYDIRTFRPRQFFATQQAGGDKQGLLTAPLSPSTNSSVTGYAESASAVTISSTSTLREAENPDMSWSQDINQYFWQTPPSTAGIDVTDQSVLSLQTLNWDQLPTEQDICDLLQMPDDMMPGRFPPLPPPPSQASASQPSVFTLSEASSLGPSASQVAPPSYHTGTDTTAQRENDVKRLRQKVRHLSLYGLWAMECFRQLEGRRGQTATQLQADEAYRPLLHSTLMWPANSE